MPMKQQNASIIDAITQEETKLTRLDAERAEILERLGKLRKQLPATDVEPALSQIIISRKDCPVSHALQRAGGCLPETVGQQERRPQRLHAGLRQ